MIRIKKYGLISLLLACMVMVIAFSFGNRSVTENEKPTIQGVKFQDRTHDCVLTPFYNTEEDCFYLFVPSFSRPEEIRVKTMAGLRLQDQNKRSVRTLGDIPTDQYVTVETLGLFTKHAYTLRVLQSEAVNTLLIDVPEGGLEKIHQSKTNWENVAVRCLTADGQLQLNQWAVLSGRGNGTWHGQAKRPYNLNFSKKISVGPFADISRLSLLAEYSDESKMRNAIAFYAGEQTGIPFTSPYDYADLYINGEYMGLYGMCTKREYEKESSVKAVFELTSSVPDSTNEDQFFTTELFERRIRVLYGQKPLVQEITERLERVLDAKDWEACPEVMDLHSFAKKYALDEFVANSDMSFASQYFFVDQNDRVVSMLPWDYDWSLGSAITFFDTAQTTSLLTYRPLNYYCTTLLENPAFVQEIQLVMESLYTDAFIESLEAFVDETNSRIQTARYCDMIRWKDERPYGKDPYPSGFDQMSDLMDFFCDFFMPRRDFLRSYFSDPDQYYIVHCLVDKWIYTSFANPKDQPFNASENEYIKLTDEFWGNRLTDWHSASGQPLREMDETAQDVYLEASLKEHGPRTEEDNQEELYVQEQHAPTALDRLIHFRTELLIFASFFLLAVLLFATEMKGYGSRKRHGRSRKKSGKKFDFSKNNT